MHNSRQLPKRLAWMAVFILLMSIGAGATPTAMAQGANAAVTTTVLSDITLIPPSANGAMTVSRLTLQASDRTQSMVLETPVVIVVEGGAVKLWTRAGTTIDGIPVTASPSTVYVEKRQTIIVPAKTRFRIRARGCDAARLLLVTLTG